ncbi:MAG TPA: hypothetical protein DCL63_01350 [Firmicutes bacterium]|jgi:DhnA family fructose-bisphosphate aldolase class Ia|nr:hypothetical protein [Bacillota bacterium]
MGIQCCEGNDAIRARRCGPDQEDRSDLKTAAHACRIAVECGADIVKCAYTGDIESFSAIAQSLGVPLVILGGPKMSSVEQVLSTRVLPRKAGDAGTTICRISQRIFAYLSGFRAMADV